MTPYHLCKDTKPKCANCLIFLSFSCFLDYVKGNSSLLNNTESEWKFPFIKQLISTYQMQVSSCGANSNSAAMLTADVLWMDGLWLL